MRPLVTCVIAAHNHSEQIERATRSVLDQQGLPQPALELLVDDGECSVATNRAFAPARVIPLSLGAGST
jgi:hypothetical protein